MKKERVFVEDFLLGLSKLRLASYIETGERLQGFGIKLNCIGKTIENKAIANVCDDDTKMDASADEMEEIIQECCKSVGNLLDYLEEQID